MRTATEFRHPWADLRRGVREDRRIAEAIGFNWRLGRPTVYHGLGSVPHAAFQFQMRQMLNA